MRPTASDLHLTRREALRRAGLGMGLLAGSTLLADLLGGAQVWADTPNLDPRTPPLPSKARAVIHLWAGGAPSHIDTFDPKPALERVRDTAIPGHSGVAFPSPFKFPQCGKSGLEISEIFPQLGQVADELCVIRSMTTDVPAHSTASKLMHTGSLILPKPSVGSWVMYGLGSGNRSLPGFVTLGGAAEWRQSVFLPSLFQGTRADFAAGRPVDRVLGNLRNEFSTMPEQRRQLDLVGQLNQSHLERVQRDEQLEARGESFELGYRMETEAVEAFDINREPKEVRELYGKGEIAARLLCARRLVERGVRFVQIDVGGWDHHTGLGRAITRTAESIDRAAAALITDLKRRGLLDSTLVWWGGEFGRTATCAGKVDENSGRDHHSKCFSHWLAGGGVKGGTAYGATDELGTDVAEKPVTVHDLHATILRLLGFDHKQLTYRYNGRDFRLTDNLGKIVEEIIA